MTLKRRLRSGLDYAARLSGVLQGLERRMNRGLTILTYHRVLPEPQCRHYPFQSLVMPDHFFRQQMQWLVLHCEVLPLVEALERNISQGSRKRPLVSVTFDDGYEDNHDIAAAILDETGLRATFFVTTGFIGTKSLLWFDRAALLMSGMAYKDLKEIVNSESSLNSSGKILSARFNQTDWMKTLKECSPETRHKILVEMEQISGPIDDVKGYRAMSVEQLVDLHKRGHEIGSHTVTHALLPQLTDTQLESELIQSRQALERWLGVQHIQGFCYPNGDGNARTDAAVRTACYRYACTTRPGINLTDSDLMQLTRIGITQNSVSNPFGSYDNVAFRSELCGLHDVWR